MARRRKEVEVDCGICGRIFRSTGTSAKYCSEECAREAVRRQNVIKREMRKRLVNSDLEKMAREANEAGMTYGKYVAYLWTQANFDKKGTNE